MTDTQTEPQLDRVGLKILHSQFASICEEMCLALMRTSYSSIFSEGLDFTSMVLDEHGNLVAMAARNPSMLGQALFAGTWVIEEIGEDTLEVGDVYVHNDPYRGGSHMPEHLFVTPFFHEGERCGFVATLGHVAEIGGMAPGSFAANATEIYQEGLRLPPVKIMDRGEPVKDVWRMILTNHRTPDVTWGDFHALIGALNVGNRRMEEVYSEHGADAIRTAIPQLFDYSEEWLRRDIAKLPNGTYSGEDCQEDDGVGDQPYFIRADVTVDDDQLIVNYSRSDPQARGPINASYVVAASGTYNGVFNVIGSDAPINAGAIRPIHVISPAGTVMNAKHPGACVGGQTELQGRILDLIQGLIFGQLLPERVAAASGGTVSNFLFGGIHPDTDEYYVNYHLEGIGWGGRATTDGNNAQIVPHGNCRNTPIEVLETRYPWTILEYQLGTDRGGPGRTRGGLGIDRRMRVEADEITVTAITDRSRVKPWGLYGGHPGANTAILVRRAGTDEFLPFMEAFGTPSNTKFSNVRLHKGDEVYVRTASGGGYGPPRERPAEKVLEDVLEGFVSLETARDVYGVVINDGAVDHGATEARRRELRDGTDG